jgi:hypothetical protein
MSYLSFSRHLRVAVPCAALLVLGSACVGNPPADVSGVIWVSTAPPRPIHEVRPYRPGPEYFWIEGYHRWTGAEYEWVPGHWEQRPRPHAKWNRGRWYHGDRGWYWVDGRWQGGDDDDHDDHGRGHGRH